MGSPNDDFELSRLLENGFELDMAIELLKEHGSVENVLRITQNTTKEECDENLLSPILKSVTALQWNQMDSLPSSQVEAILLDPISFLVQCAAANSSPQPNEKQLQALLDMGFSKPVAQKALEANNSDLELALHWLLHTS